jgi:hypothetical protein
MARRSRRTAALSMLVGLPILVASVLVPVPADASTGYNGTECAAKRSSNTYFTVCFQHTGEIFYVRDNEKDGESAIVEWTLMTPSGQRHGRCINSLGYGVVASCNYAFGNGYVVKFFGYTQENAGRSGGKHHQIYGGQIYAET